MGRESPKCKADPRIIELAHGLKTLSDPSRIRIICFLCDGEACACDVEQHLGISQQLTSHHLHMLLDAGFLRMRKDGTRIHYSIDVDYLRKICETFEEYADWTRVKEVADQSV